MNATKVIKSQITELTRENWVMSHLEFRRQIQEDIIKYSPERFEGFTHTAYEYQSHLNWYYTPNEIIQKLAENAKKIKQLKAKI